MEVLRSFFKSERERERERECDLETVPLICKLINILKKCRM